MERKARLSGQAGVGMSMGMGMDVKPSLGTVHGDGTSGGDDGNTGWLDQLLRQGMAPQQGMF
jgi:hypothetical protein